MSNSNLLRLQTALLVCNLIFINAYCQTDTLWTRVYDVDINMNYCIRLLCTVEDGLALAGASWIGANGDGYYFLVKTNAVGEQEWIRYYYPSVRSFFGGLTKTSNGDFVLAGVTYPNRQIGYANILRANANGDSIWSNTYGDGYFDDIVVGHDGYAVAAGNTDEYARFGAWDAYLVKVDDEGEVIWRGVYGGQGRDQFVRIIATSDSGYLMVGETTSFGGLKGYIVKTDSAGTEVWFESFGSEENAVFQSVIETPDGGYLAGGSQRVNNVQNFYCVKLTSDGEEEWDQVFHYGREGCHEQIKDLVNAPGGGFLIVGYNSTDYSAIRLDANGDPLWALDLSDMGRSRFSAVLPTENDGYVIGGRRFARFNGGDVAWLVRLGPDSTMLHEGIVLPDPAFPCQFTLASPFPNPFNSATNLQFTLPRVSQVRLSIYNLSGREIAQLWNRETPAGFYTVTWQANAFPSGTYFAEIAADGSHTRRKLVLMR